MTDKILKVVEAMEDKKAKDIVVIDFEKSNPSFDYAVICTGSSDRNVQAIANSVEDAMGKIGEPKLGGEGYAEGKWILIDFGDFIVNVFDAETRDTYRLEQLWNKAKVEKR